ncbi:MAG: hypothetical protein JWM57_2292, partial [Phycisphaerales bacterium]|nr:hypothetical protein [Phycisphaerales bacterium]
VVQNTVAGTSFTNLTAVGTQVFYTASNGALAQSQLRYYDPAVSGGSSVLIGGQYLVTPTRIVRAGNGWYFGAVPADAPNGSHNVVQRLYRIDIAASSKPIAVTDIATGTFADNEPVPIGAIGSTIYFSAYSDAAGTELWKSDGTAAGTMMVADLTPGTGSSNIDSYSATPGTTLPSGGALYFGASPSGGDPVAWRTDGTAAGTLSLGSATYPSSFVESLGRVYFVATPAGAAATSIYRVDGTTETALTSAGTGDAAFSPTRLIAAGNNIYALGIAGNRARFELWRGDASLNNYAKLLVLAPRVDPALVGGTLSGFFSLGRYAAAATGTNLYFPMFTPQLGVEPYRLSLATTGSISGVVFDDANADGIRQLSENPLAGETVYLDLNGNAQPDAGEPTAVSTSAGYTFAGVNTGTYAVRLQTPVGGRRTTTPGATATVTVTEGATAAAATAFGVTSLAGTAVIGGPSTVAEGSAITLDGSGSSEPFGTITTYEWDLNYTGASFEVDATGTSPTFDAGQIDGPATRVVGLRVTDANGLVSFVTKSIISITNVAPTARLFTGGPVTLGTATTATFRSFIDPSPTDQAAPLYSFDFNNDGDFADTGDVSGSSNFSAALTYATPGTYTVHGRVADKDGGSSDYYGTVLVAPVPTTTATDPASTLLEGETATFAGGTAKASGNAGYTGTGYADFGGINSSAQWSLTRNGAGPVTLSFRYANGGTTDRPLSITVNGTVIGTVACVPTGSWTTWTTVTIAANLVTGANTIKATASASVGGANVDSLTVLSQPTAPPAWLSLGGGASYTLSGNTLIISGGTATLLSDAGATNPGLSIIVNSGAAIVANTTQHLGALGVAGTFTMAAGGGKVLRVTALSQSASAGLNLNDNDLIIDYTGTPPTAEVRSFIASARAGGAWTMAGIRSASAAANAAFTLGYTDGTDYLTTYGSAATFDGETIDATSVLVKYALAGDANLDGRVDFNDFLRLQNNFNSANAGFAGGDFDYDGKADFNDFLALQNNFGQSLPQRPAPTKTVKR